LNLLRRNAVVNLVSRVATALLWIVATPFVLSRLGAERFGIWSLFFAFYAYLTALDLGVGSTMMRFVAAQRPSSDRQALSRTVRAGVWVALGLGLIWAVVVELTRGWIARAFHVPAAVMSEALDALAIFGIGVLVVFPTQAVVASLQGFERIDLSNLCVTLGVVVHVVFLCVGLSAGAGLRGAALAGVVGQAVAGLLAAILLRRQLTAVPAGGRGSGPVWRDMLHYSAALQLLWVLIMLQNQSGKIVLGLLGNLTMVADYELAFRVAFAVFTVPLLIRDPVIPTVSRIWEGEGQAAVKSLFVSTSRWVYMVSVIAFGMLWLLAPDIARVWLGPGHERIADLMRLWAVAYAVNLAYAPGVAIARGMGKPVFEVLSYAAALIVNIGLAIWWVPRLGTVGAVFAFLGSYCIGLIVFVFPFHRYAGVHPFWSWLQRHLVPRALAGLLAVALSAWILAAKPLSALLPPPGWIHGTVTATLFMAILALFFIPLGDTQLASRVLWQMTAGVWARRRGVAAT
jgi:O-antigen/teichoic acid export membrane protein